MRHRFTLFTFVFVFMSLFSFGQSREIISIAGNLTQGYSGDGRTGTNASMNGPISVAVDRTGNVYVVDYYNIRVRKINSVDTISLFAGTGSMAYTGDGGLAADAGLWPNGVAADNWGNVYISDKRFCVVRKVNAAGIISTYAGNALGCTFMNDTVPATSTTLSSPYGLACDNSGNLYIADCANHRVRKVDSTGIITTLAGNGAPAFGGDFGFAHNASLDSPMGVAADKWGNVYIADYKNNVIRKVDTNRIIYTIAGNGYVGPGYSGDGGLATNALLNAPTGVAVDTAGNVYICDSKNNRIRMVNRSGSIKTIVGNGTPAFGGDHGPAIGANLNYPQSVAVDTFGSVYIADANNQKVRKAYFPTLGVRDIYEGDKIKIYPNPANSSVYIDGLSSGESAAIYDIIGKQVTELMLAKGNSTISASLEHLHQGIYFVQVWNADGTKKTVIKFVKD